MKLWFLSWGLRWSIFKLQFNLLAIFKIDCLTKALENAIGFWNCLSILNETNLARLSLWIYLWFWCFLLVDVLFLHSLKIISIKIKLVLQALPMTKCLNININCDLPASCLGSLIWGKLVVLVFKYQILFDELTKLLGMCTHIFLEYWAEIGHSADAVVLEMLLVFAQDGCWDLIWIFYCCKLISMSKLFTVLRPGWPRSPC